MASSARRGAQSVPTSVAGPEVEPFTLPALPDLPKCPVCNDGYLYVIAADEDAKHEKQPVTKEGDPTSHAWYVPSGGSMRLQCFNCGTPQTQPLNPDAEKQEEALAAAKMQARIETITAGAA
jgi:hypothetical protein